MNEKDSAYPIYDFMNGRVVYVTEEEFDNMVSEGIYNTLRSELGKRFGEKTVEAVISQLKNSKEKEVQENG